jgi:hypothetical protein
MGKPSDASMLNLCLTEKAVQDLQYCPQPDYYDGGDPGNPDETEENEGYDPGRRKQKYIGAEDS